MYNLATLKLKLLFNKIELNNNIINIFKYNERRGIKPNRYGNKSYSNCG